MPAAGGTKISKELRMMDFWGVKWREFKLSQVYASPYTTVTEVYALGDSSSGSDGSSSNSKTFPDGTGDVNWYGVDTNLDWTHTRTLKYTDGYDIYGDLALFLNINRKIIVGDLPPGALVHRAIVMLRYSDIENYTSELSHLDEPGPFTFHTGANRLRVERLGSDNRATRYASAMSMPANLMRVPADKRTPGQIIYGSTNIKDVVSENGEYYVHWISPYLVGSIEFHEMQYGIRVWYK